MNAPLADHLQAHRLIQKLKGKGVKPDKEWIEDARRDNDAGDEGAVGPVPYSNARKSPNWSDSEIKLLLQELESHRAAIRGRFVEDEVWKKIGNNLTGKIGRDLKQIKTKVKGLKASFKAAKEGKVGGTDWPHFFHMRFLYDDALMEGNIMFAFLISCSMCSDHYMYN